MGLESCGQNFILVARKSRNNDEEYKEERLPKGFEKRIKGTDNKGWAPLLLILDHEAIGGFVTHCRWSSVLEGVCGGVPMVTWPVFAEQFYNEKLVTKVLKAGVPVGVQRCVVVVGHCIKKDAIEEGVKRIMVAEEGKEIRNKAKRLP